MTELMLKMSFWLIAAIALGFVFGWLLSKVMYANKYREEVDALDTILLERNEMLDQLEHKYLEERKVFEKASVSFRKLEDEVEEKSSLLTELQYKLEKVNSQDNTALLEKNKHLEVADKQRLQEVKEFEAVLIKAEEKLEENEKAYTKKLEELEQKLELLTLDNHEKTKTMELYQSTIVDFEEELKLYTATSEDDKFVISKDQFTKIEEQLDKYQQEILNLKSQNSELTTVNVIEKTFKKESEAINDGSIVKIFKETYKKITKS